MRNKVQYDNTDNTECLDCTRRPEIRIMAAEVARTVITYSSLIRDNEFVYFILLVFVFAEAGLI